MFLFFSNAVLTEGCAASIIDQKTNQSAVRKDKICILNPVYQFGFIEFIPNTYNISYIYPHVHNWATVSFKLYLNYTKLRFHKIMAKLDSWKSCEIQDANVKLKCNFIKGFGPIVIILYPIILFHLLYLVLIDTNKLYLTTTSCNFREIESCICKT